MTSQMHSPFYRLQLASRHFWYPLVIPRDWAVGIASRLSLEINVTPSCISSVDCDSASPPVLSQSGTRSNSAVPRGRSLSKPDKLKSGAADGAEVSIYIISWASLYQDQNSELHSHKTPSGLHGRRALLEFCDETLSPSTTVFIQQNFSWQLTEAHLNHNLTKFSIYCTPSHSYRAAVFPLFCLIFFSKFLSLKTAGFLSE